DLGPGGAPGLDGEPLGRVLAPLAGGVTVAAGGAEPEPGHLPAVGGDEEVRLGADPASHGDLDGVAHRGIPRSGRPVAGGRARRCRVTPTRRCPRWASVGGRGAQPRCAAPFARATRSARCRSSTAVVGAARSSRTTSRTRACTVSRYPVASRSARLP